MDANSSWEPCCKRGDDLRNADADGYAAAQWSAPWCNPRPWRRDVAAFPLVKLSDLTRVTRRHVPQAGMRKLSV